jgi:lipopolysaccharide transport system permease protein
MNQAPTSPASSSWVVIQPPSGLSALDFREVWRYRDLLSALAQRDVRLRYRQTAMGVAWVVFQPLIGALIFSILFGKVGKFPTDGLDAFVFAFAGFMAYNSFSATMTKASSALVQNAPMISKVYFPRIVLPLSSVFGSLIDFAVSLIIMAGLMIVYHVPLTPAILLLPVWLLFIQILATGMGLFFASLMVTYRDVQYALPVLIQFGTFAAPVAYPVSFAVQGLPAWVQPIYSLIPMTGLLDGFRASLLGTPVYSVGYCIYALVASLGIFLLGLLYFQRVERRFADVI